MQFSTLYLANMEGIKIWGQRKKGWLPILKTWKSSLILYLSFGKINICLPLRNRNRSTWPYNHHLLILHCLSLPFQKDSSSWPSSFFDISKNSMSQLFKWRNEKREKKRTTTQQGECILSNYHRNNETDAINKDLLLCKLYDKGENLIKFRKAASHPDA